MYTDPEIVHADDLTKRSYITFYFKGNRQRIYSGKQVGAQLFPNKAKTTKERSLRLFKLRDHLMKLLINQEYPYVSPELLAPVAKELTTQELLDLALKNKLMMKLSQRYKDDLTLIHSQFVQFLQPFEKFATIDKLEVSRMEEFLQRFASSGTYYMRRRSDLSILLNTAYKLASKSSPTQDIQRVRTKATLHDVYSKAQLNKLLKYLKEHSPKLYLCCLITYGCWLRPHVEVRCLRKGQFSNDYTEIHLDGSGNKGGGVRIVYVPQYVRDELGQFLDKLSPKNNIFSHNDHVLNEDYFSTMWGRLRKVLLDKGLIHNKQTIYSFRHTAAVFLFRKTKDIYLLQRMMDHSDIAVTQDYLRGLGEVDIQEQKNSAPELW